MSSMGFGACFTTIIHLLKRNDSVILVRVSALLQAFLNRASKTDHNWDPHMAACTSPVRVARFRAGFTSSHSKALLSQNP